MSSKTKVRPATSTTTGMIKKPYFENFEKETWIPFSDSILTHIMPARAPTRVKLAPKLLPAISANVEPNRTVAGTVKEELWNILTKNIVIG